MTAQLPKRPDTEIIYPDSDGRPMADNTKQFEWIVLIKKNLDALFAERPDVFVAGDLLWYPVEGEPKIRLAPDAMVVFGRSKGDRGSYQQWKEGGVAPQVVFEILSPGNTRREMERKLLFYERYGVEEYYIYDPDAYSLEGWLRHEPGLEPIEAMQGWVSPRLGIRFELLPDNLVIYRPDGEPFLSYEVVKAQVEAVQQEVQQAQQQVQIERQARLDAVPKLRAMGLAREQIADALGLSIEELGPE
ncbi:Uma2 family endonuclease [filamentous cyanobacterium LEGE 11480]|uniref:Uma2 family endonuclease n=1 Tax=Romeriopsis navalis LEGE 11480 TaxID=2777977 RepID=A0A928VQF9_9CYAN|nr:Uma2 family endonuclease [Romeriopsis navalis]MBE9032878.1 Uma2 family endonuclease [Romeriopsis navalis LEGE 11480]